MVCICAGLALQTISPFEIRKQQQKTSSSEQIIGLHPDINHIIVCYCTIFQDHCHTIIDIIWPLW